MKRNHKVAAAVLCCVVLLGGWARESIAGRTKKTAGMAAYLVEADSAANGGLGGARIAIENWGTSGESYDWEALSGESVMASGTLSVEAGETRELLIQNGEAGAWVEFSILDTTVRLRWKWRDEK